VLAELAGQNTQLRHICHLFRHALPLLLSNGGKMMTDATLIETLQFGPDDAPEQKYEIYGYDEKTPAYALIYRQHDGDWERLDEKLTFAARDEQKEVAIAMDYGSGDSLPALRDLPAEAREHCERHWQNSRL